jgi:hypothetical protein
MALALRTITLHSGIITPKADLHILETRAKTHRRAEKCQKSAQKRAKSAISTPHFQVQHHQNQHLTGSFEISPTPSTRAHFNGHLPFLRLSIHTGSSDNPLKSLVWNT